MESILLFHFWVLHILSHHKMDQYSFLTVPGSHYYKLLCIHSIMTILPRYHQLCIRLGFLIKKSVLIPELGKFVIVSIQIQFNSFTIYLNSIQFNSIHLILGVKSIQFNLIHSFLQFNSHLIQFIFEYQK